MKKWSATTTPLIVYFTLAYSISWIIWFPLYSPAFGIKNLPVLPFHHGLGGLGPMLAALITTWIYEGMKGLKLLLRQMVKVRPLLFVLIALLSPFILAVMAAGMNFLLSGQSIQLAGLFQTREFPEFSFLTFLLYNLVFFGFGEEAGWRGFALPRLQAGNNALWAAIILTFCWAIWHWPLFLYRPGFVQMGIAGTIGWFFSLLTGSVLLTWLYNSSRASILVCAIFHSTVDIAFLADFADQHIINYMGMLITLWGIGTILVFKPRHLSHVERTYR
jgi:membrane protease YdiL (CAAX protease family)